MAGSRDGLLRVGAIDSTPAWSSRSPGENLVFRRTQVLNQVCEQLLRDHLQLGRPDLLQVVFDRQIRKTTPGTFKTRVLRRGVVSCLKVFYNKSSLKEYNKGGLVLRLEVCVNNPRDFTIGKSLVHLDYLGTSRITHSRAFRRRKRWPWLPPWTARVSSGW